MIAGTSGRIGTKTARDHDRRPECLTTELRHNRQNRRIAPLRFIRLTFGMPQAAATALAVIDGAGEPLTPSQVSDRVLIASATMTATLDLLEQRGWIRRMPNPADRRSVLVEITPAGRATTDQLLPGIRTLERGILSALTPDERAHLLDMLAKVLARTTEVAADQQPEPLSGPRVRPARLSAPAGS